MEKLIITAAICGAEVTKEHNEKVPYTVSEIGEEAEAAFKAGASIIHLHVREDSGVSTQDKERFKLCIEEIKKRCPGVIIQPSTGGAVGMTNEERLQPIYLRPEMATLDCGTCNFGGDDIFVNTENTIIEFSNKMKELNIKPELEVFDKGMIDMVIRLNKKGIIKAPLHFNFVLGVNGGISAELRDFSFMKDSLPAGSTFTAAGLGRFEFTVAAMSIISGGHVRVGFEDNVYVEKGVKAKSNGELVEKAVRLSRELGREIASPEEARKILGIGGF
ncbi:3-keto-5-aminohexanoate cleavage protein [Clostridium sp. 19966]|uniref:3-keto-5-aminohexanoate cleavage enzyme n=1 Tax=Clostridium sp. 19966 TaxID=2768166 RepID=UPI0028DF7657|nr:3-keto-5-aminohexanoate cleavage protein [Clostridium sp. 19966]MDT8717847.1 3-keto-5-aminohexanoate cleavage protein [Clostridium sp. 19966]